MPVNGTLESILCHKEAVTNIPMCEKVVDLTMKPQRLKVRTYHVSMGFFFVITCCIAAVWSIMTSKENARGGIISSEINFTIDVYQQDHDYNRNDLYRWEVVFWMFVGAVHICLMLPLTSPVDGFDCMVICCFALLCIMYLCKPRNLEESAASIASPTHGAVLCLLLMVLWMAFTSIPHIYEADRLWLLGGVFFLDSLLIVTHVYDSIPTMYTIVMGRLIYTVSMEALVVTAFYCLKHRLSVHSMYIPPT